MESSENAQESIDVSNRVVSTREERRGRFAEISALVISSTCVAASLFVLYEYMMFLRNVVWSGNLAGNTLALSAPYLLAMIALILFSVFFLVLRSRVAIKDAAIEAYIKNSHRSEYSMVTASQLLRAQNVPKFDAQQPSSSTSVEVISAGEWVLSRFRQGNVVVAIPSKIGSHEQLTEFFGKNAQDIKVLRKSAPLTDPAEVD